MQWQEDSKAAIAKAAQEREFQGTYRHQFFQTPGGVEVNVLAKNLTPERVTVHVEEKRLHVVTKDENGQQDYELDIPLYAKVRAGSRPLMPTSVAKVNFYVAPRTQTKSPAFKTAGRDLDCYLGQPLRCFAVHAAP